MNTIYLIRKLYFKEVNYRKKNPFISVKGRQHLFILGEEIYVSREVHWMQRARVIGRDLNALRYINPTLSPGCFTKRLLC